MKRISIVVFSLTLGLALHFGLSAPAAAANPGTEAQEATITGIEGAVKIFSNPSKKPGGPPPQVLFQGDYYSIRDAVAGDKVNRANIIRTTPGAKARVVFPNGDQYNVGPGTAYKVSWNAKNGESPEVNLMYGKIRGIIAKGGPRSKLTVRTRSATMGVRGTDFFIADGGGKEGTEVSVIRGEVEVKPKINELAAQQQAKKENKKTEDVKVETIKVTAGLTADVPPPPAPAPNKKAEGAATTTAATELKKEEPSKPAEPEVIPVVQTQLRQTTKEELLVVQKTSEVKKEIQKINEAPPATPGEKPEVTAKKAEEATKKADETAKKIEALELKAVETTVQDIKTHDPTLYERIQKDIKDKPLTNVADLNQNVVKTMIEKAPEAPKKRKPFISELEDIDSGTYDKFFKTVN